MTTPMPWFPPDFAWGTATSSYQIEGSPNTDGKGPSIWDTFAHTPGRIATGETGDVACDHYLRWEQDLDLAKEVGCNAYRFSISWPRILPEGSGRVEARGLDFYDRLVDGMLDRGIAPYATLFHWDLPQALQDAGGWYSRDTAVAFSEYAGVVAQRVGDRISAFITLNEPCIHTFFGHVVGTHAPGLYDLERVYWVIHHQLLAHGMATRAIRERCTAPVGLTNNHSPIFALNPESEADILAADRMDLQYNRQYLDPILLGRNPGDVDELYGPRSSEVIKAGDLDIIGQRSDFLGVNYYNPQWVKEAAADNPLGFEIAEAPGQYPRTAFGWPVVPEGLTDLLLRLQADYTHDLPPMFITENGTSWPESVHDQFRIDYLDAHLRAIAAAMAEGADVRGYFCWSLIDNFEWSEGTSQRFGLVNVDFDTQERVVRDSGRWFADLAGGRLA